MHFLFDIDFRLGFGIVVCDVKGGKDKYPNLEKYQVFCQKVVILSSAVQNRIPKGSGFDNTLNNEAFIKKSSSCKTNGSIFTFPYSLEYYHE